MANWAHNARRKRREHRGRYGLALALALLAHAGFLGVLLFLSFVEINIPKTAAPGSKRPATAVQVRRVPKEQWAQNRSSPPAKKKDEAKKTEQRPDGQVVDVAPGNGQEDPNAKYLAESANKAEKETRAKDEDRTAFYRNAMPKRTTPKAREGSGKDDTDKLQISGNGGMADDDRPVRDGHQLEVPNMKRREEIALKDENNTGPGPNVANRSETAEVTGNSNRLNIPLGSNNAGESSRGKLGMPGPNLIPSMSVLDKISGAAPNDHLKDVEEGDGTYLSTREWKYSSFFNRVKQSVGMHWDPGAQLRRRDPSGNIYGGRDRHTVLNVTLNERGMVKDIYVEKSCGIDFLDLAAISSFERAQPFPNPPPGLVTADSTVRFSFGFFLEMGGGPRMRLFRQAN